MSNLSWLNPTPHAIAVYASQPPSPVATQHSLPSGRYPLLGPDFHRLDRTSFSWRTHSMTSLVLSVANAFSATAAFSGDQSGMRDPSLNPSDFTRLASSCAVFLPKPFEASSSLKLT